MNKPNLLLKFGGSSVAETAHWQTICEQLRGHLIQGNRPILVLSALKNVSNLLEALLDLALAGEHSGAITHIKELHFSFAHQLELDLGTKTTITQQLNGYFEQLQKDCEQIYQGKSISATNHAKVLATGELLSTRIASEYLIQQGFNVDWQDVRQILKSTSQLNPWHHFINAECDYQSDEAKQLCACLNNDSQNNVIVTQGFVASDINHQTVLLGREGSDTSAAYLAALLEVDRIEIWTDVSGVFSANPNDIANARQRATLSYRQASLMAQFGAKVLHPRVIQPLEQNNIPLYVKNTSEPRHPGTLISQQSVDHIAIKAIVYKRQTTQMVLPGIITSKKRKAFELVLDRLGFEVLLRHKVANEWHLILQHAHRNNIHSNDAEVMKLMANFQVKVQSNVALLTFVGEISDTTWTTKILDTLERTVLERMALTKIIGIYLQETDGRLSLLVNSKDCLSLAQWFHQQLIETEHQPKNLS